MSAPVIPSAQPSDPEQYRYGWRYVRRRGADGKVEFEMVPLTLLDVLHPQEGDVIPENSRHERLRRHFHNVFESRLARQPTLLTLSDCLIDWDRDDLRGHSPDLIVLEREEPWPWRSWGTLHVQREGAQPLFALEIVSPHTRNNDIVDKVEHYDRAGVPLYVVVDQQSEDGPLSLIGYQSGPVGYVLLEPDERGRLPLEPFGVALAVAGDRIALYDMATEEELGDYVAICEALATEVRARQIAEQGRAEAEQARADAEQARADAEQARADAEQARADAERREREQAQARDTAELACAEAERRERERAQTLASVETRMKVLEAELARLRDSSA